MITRRRHLVLPLAALAILAIVASATNSISQEKPVPVEGDPATKPAVNSADQGESRFRSDILPLLQKYCLRCHNADDAKSGVRLDQLSGEIQDRQLAILGGARKQILDEAMPPTEEPQPSADERQVLTDWIQEVLLAARKRETARNGSIRRLTVPQYRRTLHDLLGLQDEVTESLPPDGISKDGFANNGSTLLLSPLLVEAYFTIAERAIDKCLVDENQPPTIQKFRMEFGTSINPAPCPDNLILGANSLLLANNEFVVTEPRPDKPFAYQPFAMRTKYDFIEGYAGNDTVRGWRHYDSIYHSVFACVRGTPGYPKGEAYRALPDGLALRPAIPSSEIFGQSNTYGPMANFKISLRELPDRGNFRVTVNARRYDDGLLLNAGESLLDAPATPTITVDLSDPTKARNTELTVGEAGIYQVEVYRAPDDGSGMLFLKLGERHFNGQLLNSTSMLPAPESGSGEKASAFMLIRLPAGRIELSAQYGDNTKLRRMCFRRVGAESDLAKRFALFERRLPSVGVHIGLRRDCGSTLARVGEPRRVESNEFRDYVFEGAINNFPSPEVEVDNVNYLAGVREIGVRSEYTDGRDMPRLLVRSIDFEGPYYEAWPPETHRRIFIDSPHKNDPPAYAREILQSFATRAFRRPVTSEELNAIVSVWTSSFATSKDFRQSIKDALVVVLTSPQFLFLIERSEGPAAEPLDDYELASKLSYFLWNTSPDAPLLKLAAEQKLHDSLDAEVDRMIRDPRFAQFTQEFVSQWMSLDKFDVVSVDMQRFAKLTRDTKAELRKEPVQFVQHLIRENLPLRNLVRSDFIFANEVVASYYDLSSRTDSGFDFVAIEHPGSPLGGVLTQASILAGLSDGRESNPIKRGAWLARKIVAEPPDDPPPNVPRLKENDGSKLSLREKLELHRNQPGCAKCHAGIDPWGMPFENHDAGGRLKSPASADTRSRLPDGTEVADLGSLKNYLAETRIDRVAYSFAKHLATYAVGRSLSYNELVFLEEEVVKLRERDYPMQDLVRFVVKSDLFLKK